MVFCMTLLCAYTLGTRGFSRVRQESSVLAEGRHIFSCRLKPRAGHYKDLTETGNHARKVSGTQGRVPSTCIPKKKKIMQDDFLI